MWGLSGPAEKAAVNDKEVRGSGEAFCAAHGQWEGYPQGTIPLEAPPDRK